MIVKCKSKYINELCFLVINTTEKYRKNILKHNLIFPFSINFIKENYLSSKNCNKFLFLISVYHF